MGAAQASVLTLVAECDSEAQPGQKCILGKLVEFEDGPIPLDASIDEAMIFHKYPILPGSDREKFLKRLDYVEHGPNQWSIKVILDGQKLDAEGQGRGDGMDKVDAWFTYTAVDLMLTMPGETRSSRCRTNVIAFFVDPLSGGVWADEASDEEAICVSSCYALRHPDRVEFCYDHFGVRDASEERAASLYKTCDAISSSLLAAKACKVQVAHCVPSIKEPGSVSNLSEPIDAANYHALFGGLVATLKSRVSTLTKDDGACFIGEAFRPEVNSRRVKAEVMYSVEAGTIRLFEIAIESDGSVAWPAWSRVVHCVVHQHPLRVETWQVGEDKHISNPFHARQLQRWILSAIDTASDVFSGVPFGFY